MEEGPESAEARASREASGWLIVLQEEPDDLAVKRRFEDWLRASPVNAQAWMAMQHIVGVASTMAPEFADRWQAEVERDRAAQSRVTPFPSRRPRGRTRRWALAGAALAVAACLALVAGPGLLLRLQSDYRTGTAQQERLGLQDGSEVTLAAGSAVAVSYEAGERRVTLLAGEAFFNVTPDPQRLFRVFASNAEAKVLGTSFNVRLEPRGVVVAVAEGAVQVGYPSRTNGASEKLEAGQAARLAEDGRIARASVPAQLVAAWRHGQLYLDDETMRGAVDRLRRHFPGTIVFADEALAERRVTGVYNLEDPQDALLGIVRAHGATMREITPWLIVLSSP